MDLQEQYAEGADRVRLPLDAGHGTAQVWVRVAERSLAWLAERGLSPRDAVVLLPFAQHLAPARRAFGASGRWLPQIATTHSLAASLGPNVLAGPGEISFDKAIDALTAARLLATQSWAVALRERDERAWRLGVTRLVELAHALLRAAHQRAPGTRDAFWQNARDALAVSAGQPGGAERALALVAIEWAAADTRVPPTDALFALTPGAWIVVSAGGDDALTASLLAASRAPRLVLDSDIEFADARAVGTIELAACPDFESMAQAGAAAVLEHLIQGRAPLALIAQDRVLLRRLRALLERQGVGIEDETGWTLATSAPAAQLMALLRAAQPLASLDDCLAWLKSTAATQVREHAEEGALDTLESTSRRRGWHVPRQVHAESLPPPARALWLAARDVLHGLRDTGNPRSLQAWIASLRASVAVSALQQLPAGKEVLEALWITRQPWEHSAHQGVLDETELRLKDFVTWVGETLEAQAWTPQPAGAVQVVVTPLARAMLRPFGAIVLPGADAQSLPLTGRLPELLSDAQAGALGLPDQAAQRQALARAFTQLLRAPHVTLLRRTAAGAEPLAPSPLLERLEITLGALPAWRDPRATRSVAAEPQERAAARVAGLLPASLSASQIDALRNCPYQFFGRVLLGLQEADELEATADKRDYGIWLHGVLLRFHRARQTEPDGEDEALLRRCAEEEGAPPEEDFLPYTASFERFVPRYLAWLADTERTGQRFVDGETDAEIRPFLDAALAGITVRGRLDRVDRAVAGEAGDVLIDYKTGSLAGLKKRVADPLEDTQLAVYAALRPAVQAGYLALDDKDGIAFVAHADVQRSAAILIEGLGDDLAALHGGAPLPALGEGIACEYCAMRGLCRKDDWQ